MNELTRNMLRDLAEEREKRSQQAAAAAAAAGEDGEGERDAGPPAESVSIGRTEERSRKKQAPKRRPDSSSAVVPRDNNPPPEPNVIAQPARAKRTANDDAGVAGSASKKSKKSKQASSAPTALEFADAGGVFDPKDMARAFCMNDFGEGRDGLGALAFDQFAAAARLHALETNKVRLADVVCF